MQAMFSVLMVVLAICAPRGAESASTTPKLEVLFSPDGDCAERLVQEINAAKKSVRLQACSLITTPIAEALLGARKRGVDCEIVLGMSPESQSSELDNLAKVNVSIFVDERHMMSPDILLIDKATIIIGSLTSSTGHDESNAGSVLIIKGFPDLVEKYAENFARHHDHVRKYGDKVHGSGQPRSPPNSKEEESTVKPVSKAGSKPSEPDADPIVYVTKTGSKYHRQSCSFLRKSSIPIKLSEAKAKYGPCSRCRPPT